MLKQLVLLCGLVACAYAAIALGPHEPKPEKFKNVPGCYIQESDTVIPFGATSAAKPPRCLRYHCDTEYVRYESCGEVEPPPDCVVVEYFRKPYPDCCPKIECQDLYIIKK